MISPDPTSIARPLLSSGPPFPVRARPSSAPPQPGVVGIDPEEVASSSGEDDAGDQTMAEGDAEESSSGETASGSDDGDEE